MGKPVAAPSLVPCRHEQALTQNPGQELQWGRALVAPDTWHRGSCPRQGRVPLAGGFAGSEGAKQGEGGGGTGSAGGEVLLWKQITRILQRKHKFCLIGGKCREEEKDNISKKCNETWIVHSHSPGVRNGSRGRTGSVYNPAHAQHVAAAPLPAPRVPTGSPNLGSAARLLRRLRAAAVGALLVQPLLKEAAPLAAPRESPSRVSMVKSGQKGDGEHHGTARGHAAGAALLSPAPAPAFASPAQEH